VRGSPADLLARVFTNPVGSDDQRDTQHTPAKRWGSFLESSRRYRFSSGKQHAAAGRHRRLSIVQGLRGMGKTKHLKATGAAVSLLIVSGPARAVSAGPETLERFLHRVAYRPGR